METATIDPLAGLPADLPEDMARDHAAALVKGGGVTLEQANTALSARNAAPLTANSRDMAEAARDALLNDSAFVRRYSEGDPDAIAKLFQADLRAQQASGKLTDKAPSPADYNLHVAQHMRESDDKAIQTYGDDLAKVAAKLQLPPANAQALTDAHFAALKATATMTEDEQSMYGQKETALLYNVLGADAEAKMQSASDTLNKISGGKLDLSAIVKSNGASVALMLYHQALALAARK